MTLSDERNRLVTPKNVIIDHLVVEMLFAEARQYYLAIKKRSTSGMSRSPSP